MERQTGEDLTDAPMRWGRCGSLVLGFVLAACGSGNGPAVQEFEADLIPSRRTSPMSGEASLRLYENTVVAHISVSAPPRDLKLDWRIATGTCRSPGRTVGFGIQRLFQQLRAHARMRAYPRIDLDEHDVGMAVIKMRGSLDERMGYIVQVQEIQDEARGIVACGELVPRGGSSTSSMR